MLGKRKGFNQVKYLIGSLVAQMVKNLLATQETWVQSLDQDPGDKMSLAVFLQGPYP